jgi:hypothetical protein
MDNEGIVYKKTVGKCQQTHPLFDNSSIILFCKEADPGYCTFIWGTEIHFLKWHRELDDAVEYSVETAKQFIENGVPVFETKVDQ